MNSEVVVLQVFFSLLFARPLSLDAMVQWFLGNHGSHANVRAVEMPNIFAAQICGCVCQTNCDKLRREEIEPAADTSLTQTFIYQTFDLYVLLSVHIFNRLYF